MSASVKKWLIGGASLLAFIGFVFLWNGVGSPVSVHQGLVKRFLNDPDSAKFKYSYKSKKDGDFWCGELNARNRMGGYIGYHRYVMKMPWWFNNSSEEQIRELVNYHDVMFFEGNDGFAGKWRLFCE